MAQLEVVDQVLVGDLVSDAERGPAIAVPPSRDLGPPIILETVPHPRFCLTPALSRGCLMRLPERTRTV